MAPQVGLEPTTLRLTAGCSAIELLRSVVDRAFPGRWTFDFHHSISGRIVKTVWPVLPLGVQKITLAPVAEPARAFLLRYFVGLGTPLATLQRLSTR
jgi:hypothetical protein